MNEKQSILWVIGVVTTGVIVISLIPFIFRVLLG